MWSYCVSVCVYRVSVWVYVCAGLVYGYRCVYIGLVYGYRYRGLDVSVYMV